MTRLTLVICVVACACGAAPSPAPGVVPAPTGVRWARTQQLPVELDDDPRGRALMDTIAAKRVVFLGEPDHYIHEKYAMRLAFLRRLFARGWRRIGMEMGYSDGAHIDAYLESGDERELDRVGIYRTEMRGGGFACARRHHHAYRVAPDETSAVLGRCDPPGLPLRPPMPLYARRGLGCHGVATDESTRVDARGRPRTRDPNDDAIRRSSGP